MQSLLKERRGDAFGKEGDEGDWIAEEQDQDFIGGDVELDVDIEPDVCDEDFVLEEVPVQHDN